MDFTNPQVVAASNTFVAVSTQRARRLTRRVLQKYCGMDIMSLCEEWQKHIKLFKPPGMTTTAFAANKPLNRYNKGVRPRRARRRTRRVCADVVCVDATRVVLRDGAPGDYIHANHVKGDPFINTFICTQVRNATATRTSHASRFTGTDEGVDRRLLAHVHAGERQSHCHAVRDGRAGQDQV